MWISTEKLQDLDSRLEKNLDKYIKVFVIHYLVYNNYYHLINNKTLKETYHLLEEIDLNDFIELNWFFNKETNIKSGWEDLETTFSIKFKNIYLFINGVKNKIKNYPINNNNTYIKNNTII